MGCEAMRGGGWWGRPGEVVRCIERSRAQLECGLQLDNKSSRMAGQERWKGGLHAAGATRQHFTLYTSSAHVYSTPS